MNSFAALREPFRTTCEKIFRPPAGQVVEWREVRALFREIGETQWQPNGDLKITRNGHALILRPPPSKDVGGPDELLELRRFIERSETAPSLLTAGSARVMPSAVARVGS